MIFKNNYFFILLTFIWVQKSVYSITIKEIYDINGIKKFIQGIIDKKPAEYHLEKELSDDEKSKIIVDDLVGLLENLNTLTDRNYNASRDFVVLLNTFEKKFFEQIDEKAFNYVDLLNGFDNVASKINSYDDILMESRNKFGYNLARYCPVASNITKNIILEKKGIIIEKYDQVQYLKRYINDYKFYNSCGKRALTEQLFYHFYQQMVTTYLKEYVVRYYLDVINRQCPEKNLIRTKMDEFVMINRLQSYIKSFDEKSQRDVTSLYRCDPPNYDNSNEAKYYELTRMIQATIVKEEDLDIRKSCRHNCDTDTIQNSMNLTMCQGYQRCQYVSKSFEICEMPDNDQSGRIYQWFKNSEGLVYGDNSTECKTPVKTVSSILSSNFYWCDYCLCTCVKKKLSRDDDVLFVSFREQLTDIEKNMIVVGVRFMKKNNMIHVQIKEAELKPLGLTEKSEWKELENFHYNETIGIFFVKNDNGTQTFLKENVDYGFPDQIRLADVRAPNGFVITGVAFQFFEVTSSQESYSSSLQLRIRVTPFDYFEGRLINDNQTKWISTECDIWRYGYELDLRYPDLPTKAPKNNIYWTGGDFVKFQTSDLIKDAGQSTVPFFDAQDVDGDPEFPLGGIGVLHRGHEGYGGFLIFRIFTTRLSNVFKSDLYDS